MAILTASDVRAQVGKPLEDAGRFTDELLDALIAEFTEVAEQYRGVAYEPTTIAGETHFVPRPVTRLTLRHALVRLVDTVIVNSTVTTAYDVDLRAGILWLPIPEASTVAVTYSHGYDEPPSAVLRACREYVRSCALTDRSGVPRDVIAQSFGDGSYTRFSTPDMRAGRPTGWLEVDRLLNMLPDYRSAMA